MTKLEDRDKEISTLLEDRAQAHRSIREEYNKKLQELSSTNKKAFESMQKKRDEMAEQMRVYQAEIQEKRAFEIEAKRFKQQALNLEERVKNLIGQNTKLAESSSLLESSFQEMMKALENIKFLNNKEIDELIDCMTSVVKMSQKGEKISALFMRERVKDDTLKKMKPFLESLKVKL